MNLINLSKRLEKLIPDGLILSNIYGLIINNKTFKQLTQYLNLDQKIELSIYLNAIKKGENLDAVKYFMKHLYMVDIICFDDEPMDMTCDNCNGNGDFDCGYCGGSGEESCNSCDGSGKVENDEGESEDCDDCGGDGYESCDHCDGKRRESCYQCGGSGDVDGPDNIPGITVYSYVGYNPKILDKLSLMVKEGTEDVDEKMQTLLSEQFFISNYNTYTARELSNVDEIPEEYWGNCYVNGVYEFDNPSKYVNGAMRRRKENYLEVNEVLLTTPNP